ncbi:MAG TPA: penicillin-binding protein activator [Micropepsaceae bacterium]|nr:penicillin-binding protein activator [Micropepsaceae bacterium]
MSADLASRESRGRVCAIAAVLAIGVVLAGCQTMKPMAKAPPPPPPPPPQTMAMLPPPPPPPPTRREQPNFYRLRNSPAGVVPARVALLLPLSGGSAETRRVAEALEKAAEMSVFDAKSTEILLMPRDDGGTPEKAAEAAAKAIADGAEIIVGPLFAANVTAVAPIARAGKVPVIALSSDRSVGGNGVYLLSFQPETEVNRIISYAARTGHSRFAAMIPKTAYGEKVQSAFRDSVSRAGGQVADIQTFDERPQMVGPPAKAAAMSGADAILIAEGGAMLQAIGPALALNGVTSRTLQFLGTGLWDDPSIAREPVLANGRFAAPPPESFRSFSTHYRDVYEANPPRIATLSYDAMSLVALLARGRPYQRFTDVALTDPKGFSGIDGIFRFRDDGSAERGLAILEVGQGGFSVIDPAPKSFPQPGF